MKQYATGVLAGALIALLLWVWWMAWG